MKHFNGQYNTGSYAEFFYTRLSLYRKELHTQINQFIITHPKTGNVWKEHHYQTIFTIDELYTLLQSKPLSEIAMYKDYTMKPPDDVTERTHFLLKRA